MVLHRTIDTTRVTGHRFWPNVAHLPTHVRSLSIILLAHPALAALFSAVTAVTAVLAGIARVGTSVGG